MDYFISFLLVREYYFPMGVGGEVREGTLQTNATEFFLLEQLRTKEI
jgi:hypothetical protein